MPEVFRIKKQESPAFTGLFARRLSQKMLTQTLRDLERDGLVIRTVYPVIPPRVEYSLTALGHTLEAPLNALALWAQRHMEEVQDAQAVYDRGDRQKSGWPAA